MPVNINTLPDINQSTKESFNTIDIVVMVVVLMAGAYFIPKYFKYLAKLKKEVNEEKGKNKKR